MMMYLSVYDSDVFEMWVMRITQSAHPNTLTMQIREAASHLMVTVPSTSLSQKHDPEMLSPQSAFCMIMQLAMNLKFLLTLVMFFKIYVKLISTSSQIWFVQIWASFTL